MDQLLNDIAGAYEQRIQLAGKELHFVVLVSFLLSFGFIRTSTHMIRAQVSWWPGNVETKGGTAHPPPRVGDPAADRRRVHGASRSTRTLRGTRSWRCCSASAWG